MDDDVDFNTDFRDSMVNVRNKFIFQSQEIPVIFDSENNNSWFKGKDVLHVLDTLKRL